MAIVQISQIKHRRGTSENLPQLASAELGWSIDSRQLHIGNGTLEEGAPEVGNTEILTEYSNLPGITRYYQTLQANLVSNLTSAIFNSNTQPGVVMTYNIVRQRDAAGNANVKTGTIRIAQYASDLSYDEDWVETGDTGVEFGILNVGGSYTYVYANVSANAYNANLTYTINSLST